MLYILDEPSIGLHQRDNEKRLASLKQLRDLGNTLIVVEHDEETMRAADHIIDIGLGSRNQGKGCSRTVEDIIKAKDSNRFIFKRQEENPVPKSRRKGNGNYLQVIGASENNLKNINVKIP